MLKKFDTMDVEDAVRTRYTAAAKTAEAALCCPTEYDHELLAALPAEVIERDYGCGDPSRHLRRGETVLDLGSGTGKICFIASQVVGPEGRVIGVDMNDEMLDVARRNAPEVARRVGHANTTFVKAKIQDLRTDREWLDGILAAEPIHSGADLERLEAQIAAKREQSPLIGDASVDVVVSNCVLNLVRADEKLHLFEEIYRVLRDGGRAVISDIVSDEDVPEDWQRDPELWSGCISGAFREDEFLTAFAEAGFYGITVLERQESPWRTIGGVEFRSVTVEAFKGKEGPCLDGHHAVIYRGPFSEVEDDDGHVLVRGVRTAVCEKTFRIFSQQPYRAHFDLVPPRIPVAPEEALLFSCRGGSTLRSPRETKGASYCVTTEIPAADCQPSGGSRGGCC